MPKSDLKRGTDSRPLNFKFESITEILTHIKHGGPEWENRHVTLQFSGQSNARVLIYPIQGVDAPYFDFVYTGKEPPRTVFSALLQKYPQCDFIDWSLGGLTCMEAPNTDVETLAKIIQDLARTCWGQEIKVVDAWYEQLRCS